MNMIPAATVVNSPIVNNEFADLETPRVLFMAMDAITDAEKYELPFKAFGGIYLPSIPGLRSSKYMLYRCQFTQLPSFTPVGDWDMMLPPAMRETLPRSFSQTVLNEDGTTSQKTVTGFLESNVNKIKEEGVFSQKRSNHLVFHKRFPGNDAAKATKRNAPNGIGGVVEITELKGASQVEIDAVQTFFFPEWEDIKTGEKELSSTVKGMEAHIKSRIAAIPATLDFPTREKYKLIGAAMLRSCAEFQRNAINTIKTDEVTFKSAYDKGHVTALNSDASELLLLQTETKRKGDLLSGESSSTNTLVEEMRLERQDRQAQGVKDRDLQERQLFLEEVKAGIRKPDGTLTFAPTSGSPSLSLEPTVIAVTEDAAYVVGTTAADTYTDTTYSEVVEAPERTFSVHDEVTVASRPATIIAKPFGRIKVKFTDDGSEVMVEKGQID